MIGKGGRGNIFMGFFFKLLLAFCMTLTYAWP